MASLSLTDLSILDSDIMILDKTEEQGATCVHLEPSDTISLDEAEEQGAVWVQRGTGMGGGAYHPHPPLPFVCYLRRFFEAGSKRRPPTSPGTCLYLLTPRSPIRSVRTRFRE
jgi:hypothetical protein